MKIDPKLPSTDICQTSIGILEDKVKTFLGETFLVKSLWSPDGSSSDPQQTQWSYQKSSETQDVLLLGGFLRRFLESGNWPECEYRFWVCSQAVSDVLTQLLGFSESEIGLIERGDLFPLPTEPLDFNLKATPINFVYGGRLSPSKNIECLLWTVFFLQTKYQLPITLHLFGSFDNFTSPDRGRWEITSYQTQIETLTQQIPWVIPPKFHGIKPSTEWLDSTLPHPIFVNFSTFIFEDFDVSLAQAQQKGWPFLISDWGGHRDQQQANGLMVPWKMIGRSDQSPALITLKAEVLADSLFRQNSPLTPQAPEILRSSFAPKNAVSSIKLDQLRRKFLKTLGPEALVILKEGLLQFADTYPGQQFFSRYRYLFGGPDPQGTIRVITNDLNSRIDPLNQHILKTSQNIARTHQGLAPLIFTPTREMNLPESKLCFGHDREIHFTFSHPELKSVVKTVKFLASKDCQIHIHNQSDDKETEHHKEGQKN
jgi:hypothetical protein